jgi:tetratricopeptide (TPR) repeat protein
VLVVDTPEKDADELKAEANLLMQTGRREEAKAILRALVEGNPPSEDLYEDVIYNYLLGEAYPEAKELARRFEREFGAPPTPELSLQEIEKQERRLWDTRTRHGAGGSRVFRRLSLMERGDLPRYLPWSSVVWQEVRVEPDAIVLRGRLRTHRLGWGQVRRASLTKDEAYYMSNFRYVQKLIVLESVEGETYKIDVTTMVPEFGGATELEGAIRDHLTLEEGPLRKRNEADDWLSGFLLLVGIIVLCIIVLYLLGVS